MPSLYFFCMSQIYDKNRIFSFQMVGARICWLVSASAPRHSPKRLRRTRPLASSPWQRVTTQSLTSAASSAPRFSSVQQCSSSSQNRGMFTICTGFFLNFRVVLLSVVISTNITAIKQGGRDDVSEMKCFIFPGRIDRTR